MEQEHGRKAPLPGFPRGCGRNAPLQEGGDKKDRGEHADAFQSTAEGGAVAGVSSSEVSDTLVAKAKTRSAREKLISKMQDEKDEMASRMAEMKVEEEALLAELSKVSGYGDVEGSESEDGEEEKREVDEAINPSSDEEFVGA